MVAVRPQNRLIFRRIDGERVKDAAHRNRFTVSHNGDGRLHAVETKLRDQRGKIARPFNQHQLGADLVEQAQQMVRAARRQVAHAEQDGHYAFSSLQA